VEPEQPISDQEAPPAPAPAVSQFTHVKPADKDQATPQQRKAQIDVSNSRKRFLEDKYKKEQQVKELERKKQEEEDRKAQQEKAKHDFAIKKEQIKRDKEHKRQMDREAKERQKEMEAERRIARNRLTEAAETSYKDAMRLYKQGKYAAAAAKFQDIEDIVPDYKQTRTLMEKSKRAPVEQPKVQEPAPIVAEVPAYSPAPKVKPAAAQTENTNGSSTRSSSIQKTMDLFDPNSP
jgi:TolA-binding protein